MGEEEEKEVLYWLQGQLRPHEQKLKGLEVTCAKISVGLKRWEIDDFGGATRSIGDPTAQGHREEAAGRA